MFKKKLIKKALKLLLIDKRLMYKVLFLILEKVVEDTDNQLDYKVVDSLKELLGEHDTKELK